MKKISGLYNLCHLHPGGTYTWRELSANIQLDPPKSTNSSFYKTRVFQAITCQGFQ